MQTYILYQQRPPVSQKQGKEVVYYLNLKEVGTISANNGADAIDFAKKMEPFVSESPRSLGHYPIVELLK